MGQKISAFSTIQKMHREDGIFCPICPVPPALNYRRRLATLLTPHLVGALAHEQPVGVSCAGSLNPARRAYH